MIKLFEMFAGYGGASFALKKAGIPFECVGFSEIDKYAIQCYMQNHGNIKNYGDATKINPKDLPNFDLLTGGFPCSPKGTKVKTKEGYKNIEEIVKNDMVLTHNNKFEKVNKIMNKTSNHINIIKSQGCYNLQLTDEHPLYVYRDKCFKWVEVKDLQTTDYITYNINQNSENIYNLTINECWLLGRYLADGVIDYTKDIVYFAIGAHKREEFENRINKYEYYVCHNNRNCQEFYIKNDKLLSICKLCKSGATNKEIPQDIINLPTNLLLEVWKGYFAGNGHYDTKVDRYMFSTVSEKLYLGLQDVIIKLFNKIPSCYIRKDNRSASFNDSYNGQFYNSQKNSYVVGDKLCVKINNISRIKKDIMVYNFEVDSDNSYTLNNVIVHNCQSFSVCGKGMGEQDTRGTLFHEIIRIAEIKQPKYMLLENVKGLTFKKHKDTFNKILSEVDRIGYNVRWEILNSKDYGTPQSRNRVWFVCIRKDLPFAYDIPQESPMRLFKDILEKEVDEKYYLTQHQKEFIDYKSTQGRGKPYNKRIINFPEYSQCLKTGSQKKYIVEATIFDDGKGARVLTPKECWRLMGFFNDEINVKGISDTQQYKLAGNGWDINLVSKIFINLLSDEND